MSLSIHAVAGRQQLTLSPVFLLLRRVWPPMILNVRNLFLSLPNVFFNCSSLDIYFWLGLRPWTLPIKLVCQVSASDQSCPWQRVCKTSLVPSHWEGWAFVWLLFGFPLSKVSNVFCELGKLYTSLDTLAPSPTPRWAKYMPRLSCPVHSQCLSFPLTKMRKGG